MEQQPPEESNQPDQPRMETYWWKGDVVFSVDSGNPNRGQGVRLGKDGEGHIIARCLEPDFEAVTEADRQTQTRHIIGAIAAAQSIDLVNGVTVPVTARQPGLLDVVAEISGGRVRISPDIFDTAADAVEQGTMTIEQARAYLEQAHELGQERGVIIQIDKRDIIGPKLERPARENDRPHISELLRLLDPVQERERGFSDERDRLETKKTYPTQFGSFATAEEIAKQPRALTPEMVQVILAELGAARTLEQELGVPERFINYYRDNVESINNAIVRREAEIRERDGRDQLDGHVVRRQALQELAQEMLAQEQVPGQEMDFGRELERTGPFGRVIGLVRGRSASDSATESAPGVLPRKPTPELTRSLAIGQEVMELNPELNPGVVSALNRERSLEVRMNEKLQRLRQDPRLRDMPTELLREVALHDLANEIEERGVVRDRQRAQEDRAANEARKADNKRREQEEQQRARDREEREAARERDPAPRVYLSEESRRRGEEREEQERQAKQEEQERDRDALAALMERGLTQEAAVQELTRQKKAQALEEERARAERDRGRGRDRF